MIELKPDLVEPWSYPIPHYAEQAQVWHSRRFATWLLKAGAEPRFGALLCSGPQAETRWQILLEEQGVEVCKVQSRAERPLPSALTEHRGDHFNRRLFLIDGLDEISETLDEEQRREFWLTLEGQRGQFKQTATWVVLGIRQAQTLADASQYAPLLLNSLERVCLIWSAQERSKMHHRIEHIPSKHHLVYELFNALSSADHRWDTLTLGRIFRAGYMSPSRGASEQWKWAYRLWRGEVRDPTAARFGQLGVTEPLSETVSPEDALWALIGRGAAATPARRQQWLERAEAALYGWRVNGELSSFKVHLERESTLDEAFQTSLIDLWQWANAQKKIDLAQIVTFAERACDQLDQGLTLTRSLATEWLTHAYAQLDDLEGCIRVNQKLIVSHHLWPEVKFCAFERLLDLALFTQDHGEARRCVESLEALERELHSPLFEVRFLEAKAKQLGALDESRGQSVAEAARILSERFGATWSE